MRLWLKRILKSLHAESAVAVILMVQPAGANNPGKASMQRVQICPLPPPYADFVHVP